LSKGIGKTDEQLLRLMSSLWCRAQ